MTGQITIPCAGDGTLFRDAAAWRAWLRKNHATAKTIDMCLTR